MGLGIRRELGRLLHPGADRRGDRRLTRVRAGGLRGLPGRRVRPDLLVQPGLSQLREDPEDLRRRRRRDHVPAGQHPVRGCPGVHRPRHQGPRRRGLLDLRVLRPGRVRGEPLRPVRALGGGRHRRVRELHHHRQHIRDEQLHRRGVRMGTLEVRRTRRDYHVRERHGNLPLRRLRIRYGGDRLHVPGRFRLRRPLHGGDVRERGADLQGGVDVQHPGLLGLDLRGPEGR